MNDTRGADTAVADVTTASTAPVSQTDSPAQPINWRSIGVAIVAVCAALAAVILWQALFLPKKAQNWLGGASTIPAAQFRVIQGQLEAAGKGTLQLVPRNGSAVLEIPMSSPNVEAEPMLDWALKRQDDKTSVQLLWPSGTTYVERLINFRSNNAAESTDFSRDPRWMGSVPVLRVVMKGTTPLLISDSLTLYADSVRMRLRLMWRGWFGFKPWAMSDMNYIEAVDKTDTYYFNATVTAAALLVWLGYSVMQWGRGLRVSLNALLLIVGIGWVIADIRWQVEYVQKVADSWRRFGGKTLHEKHLAADDADYYWVVEAMRPLIPASPKFTEPFNIHYNKAERYDHGKLTYYAAPNPLVFLEKAPAKGTVFGIVAVRHQFDAAQQKLTLANGQQIPAAQITARGMAAVYRAL